MLPFQGLLVRARLQAQSISAIFVTYRCGTGLGKRATTNLLCGTGLVFREFQFTIKLVLLWAFPDPH